MGEILKNLSLEYWYKMLILACFGLFVLSITVPLQGIPNTALALISMGGFFIGMGEWINHPYQERVDLYRGLKISGHPRRPRFSGNSLDVVGAIAVVWGAWKLIRALS